MIVTAQALGKTMASFSKSSPRTSDLRCQKLIMEFWCSIWSPAVCIFYKSICSPETRSKRDPATVWVIILAGWKSLFINGCPVDGGNKHILCSPEYIYIYNCTLHTLSWLICLFVSCWVFALEGFVRCGLTYPTVFLGPEAASKDDTKWNFVCLEGKNK